MPTEIVLLSDVPLDTETAHRALITVLPEAESFEFSAAGMALHVDPSQTTVLSVFTSVEVTHESAGDTLLEQPIPTYKYWTDIAIPDHSLEATARAAAQAMADAVSGHISDKR